MQINTKIPSNPKEGLDYFSEITGFLHKSIVQHGKEALEKTITLFFETYPEVEALMWEAFTPYFNDGEACIFGFYGLQAYFGWQYGPSDNGIELGTPIEELDDECFWGCDVWSLINSQHAKTHLADISDETKNALLSLSKDLASNTDLLLYLYDDHHRVIATKEGITRYDCDHD